MKVKLKANGKTQEHELKGGSTVLDLFTAANLVSEAFIVARAGEVIIEAEPLQDNDVIEFIKITSGG